MKIKIRDVALLAGGFILGAILTASLTTTPTGPPAASASRVVLTGPAMAAASLPPPVMVITNIQWQMPPVEIILPPRLIDSFDSQSPLYPPPRRPVDLIDTRYRPDIKMDDLK